MALLSNACYTYTSSGFPVNAPTETRVAGRLTTRATVTYESLVGPEVERVEGFLARANGDSVELRVLRTRTRTGEWATWKGEPVMFGVTDFASSGQRRFSRGRTALAVGALGAVLVLAITTNLFGFGGKPSSLDPRTIPPENPG